VRFKTRQGHWINNLEVTHALKDCALVQYALHQGAAGNLTLHVYGPCTSPHAARDALLNLFGLDQALTLEHHPLPTEKIIQYTSDMAGAAPL
jgi:phenylacetate-CoA ligase